MNNSNEDRIDIGKVCMSRDKVYGGYIPSDPEIKDQLIQFLRGDIDEFKDRIEKLEKEKACRNCYYEGSADEHCGKCIGGDEQSQIVSITEDDEE